MEIKTILLKMDKELHRKLKNFAYDKNLTLNNAIIKIMIEYFSNNSK